MSETQHITLAMAALSLQQSRFNVLDPVVLQQVQQTSTSNIPRVKETLGGMFESDDVQAAPERSDKIDEMFNYIYFGDVEDTHAIDATSSYSHEIQTAPLFTSSALEFTVTSLKPTGGISVLLEQY